MIDFKQNGVHQNYIKLFLLYSSYDYYRLRKKFIILLFLPLCIKAQNTIGLPEIINYSKNQYNAGAQNWDIRQDKQGVIYLANNEGLCNTLNPSRTQASLHANLAP